MNSFYILSIDQGTTGTRAIILDAQGQLVVTAYQEFKQIFPYPGWVEHDPIEIWHSVCSVIKKAITLSKIDSKKIIGLGVTNQRETTVVWDRLTGKPIYPAIVWQCRRTSAVCDSPRLQAHKNQIHLKTGLVLDPYFCATKIQWILDHVAYAKTKAKKGQLCFGTIDSWLIWNLTGGKVHATDMTNASRTMLFNIRHLSWDHDLLKLFKVPEVMLPQVLSSAGKFGQTEGLKNVLPDGIPIRGVMGDQQAALFGQGCYQKGDIKNTYGTGCFLMMNLGKKIILSKKGLLTTLACDDQGNPVYALEGSVFIGGAVIQWVRDGLHLIQSAVDCEKEIKGIKSTEGVYIVPAFSGLGAPYWQSKARGVICGLTRGSTKAHLLRAALESIAYQCKDVFDLMKKESSLMMRQLKVDGGACQNNFLMQFQSDLLNCSILRPRMIESTALGAAYLSGVALGHWQKADLKKFQSVDRYFSPQISFKKRERLYTGWIKAVQMTITGC